MEPSHDHIEKTLDKLVASTRSPRGRYSASESWKLLERRLVPPRTKRLRLFRLAGVVAASVLLCFASWFIYDYWKPVAMQTVSAGAAISVITLPDQTKVTLNRYSSLTYRKTATSFLKGRSLFRSGERCPASLCCESGPSRGRSARNTF